MSRGPPADPGGHLAQGFRRSLKREESTSRASPGTSASQRVSRENDNCPVSVAGHVSQRPRDYGDNAADSMKHLA